MEIKYTKFKLKNGIRVFLVPKKETRAIHFEVMFKVGSRYETDSIRGISHFLEHMAFKGTKKRPTALDIAKEIDRHGGIYNAYTGLDVTGYWVRLPSERIELAIDLISDIVINSKLEKKEIDKEKGVILEEIKMYDDNPGAFADIMFHKLVFGDTPLGRDVLGTKETVSTINKEMMLDFKSRLYKTNNMVIAVGGNFSIAKTKKLLEKHFGKIKGTVEDNYEKNHVIQNCPIVKVYNRRDTQQAKLMMGFRSFGRDGSDKDRVVRGLLSRVLGYYSSSVLFTEVREKRGLSYDISCGTSSFDETGVFMIGGGFDVNKVPEAIRVICKVLKDIKNKGFQSKDIQRGKDNKIGQLELSIEGASNWASSLASNDLYGMPIELPDEIIRKTKGITNADIKRVAKQIFKPENFNMVIVGPIDSSKEKGYLKLIKL